MMTLSRNECIDLVERIMQDRGNEQEIDQWLVTLEQNVPHPEISNLIFWNDKDYSAAEIVDKALAYQPILLPPSPSS
ncbi:bacteriocin immunity protein [Paenibacillus sp. CFBP13512]|uniref:bacteriocin immunity protein n=1 Tax=Paenibacillus sp. CFBP13512 TaxID=2184007 RepID=UPI001F4FDC9A|nr:bacteriocin immunity protein [Paenibacillus sp. CFBP13512]